jgi:tetratricopeptide (TPR) repeat protein
MLAIAGVSQLLVALRPVPTSPAGTETDSHGPSLADVDQGPSSGDGASDIRTAAEADLDVDRIRANVAFWSKRVAKQPDDFISSNRWGIAEIELGRATGDVTAYLRAEAAFDVTLKRDPANAAALGYKGSVLVSLHRFVEAADLARTVRERRPNDPVALATLGDASLELGHVDDARRAYEHADAVAPGSATLTRRARLSSVTGDSAAAVRLARQAVEAGVAEGVEGERAAFLQYQLGEVLITSGDIISAGSAYRLAVDVDDGSFLAHSGLARVAATRGNLDEAIRQLSVAISIVPQPEFLARRGDLYTLRGRSGDDRLAADDYATVEAIAKLAGEAASVYDRTLVYYLANHGLDAERAVRMAAAELEVRKDVYGYDAYAWALLAAGRGDEAQTAMATALAFGTRDAKLLYHAGMIAAARGDRARARSELQAALHLDPSFDPLQVERARMILAQLP